MHAVIGRFRLQTGGAKAWERAFARRIADARSELGWAGVLLLRPVDEPDVRVVVGLWTERNHYVAWTKTPSHTATNAEMDAVQAGPPEVSWHDVIMQSAPLGRLSLPLGDRLIAAVKQGFHALRRQR